jgi:hypothetical protein
LFIFYFPFIFPNYCPASVMPRQLLDLLACWQGWFGKHHSSEIWKVIPPCLMWCVWRERNSRLFEDGECSILDLRSQFLRTLFDWLSVTGLFSFTNLLESTDLCNFGVLLIGSSSIRLLHLMLPFLSYQ